MGVSRPTQIALTFSLRSRATMKHRRDNATLTAIAVRGSDLDLDVCRHLTAQDKIMLEVNGLRLYSKRDCPLVDLPWTVVTNGEALVVQHLNGMELTLPYAAAKNSNPAVFKIFDSRIIAADHFYAIPQFISRYMASEITGSVFKPCQRDQEKLFAEPARRLTYQKWSGLLEAFDRGWTDLGMSRFALRCYVDLNRLEAIRDLNWELIDAMTYEEFQRIHRAFHWHPTILQASAADI